MYRHEGALYPTVNTKWLMMMSYQAKWGRVQGEREEGGGLNSNYIDNSRK